MKKHVIMTGLAGIVAAGLAAGTAGGDVIQPVDIDFSSELSPRNAVDIINGNGLTGTDTSATHNATVSDMWLSGAGEDITEQWLRFDLGNTYDVTKIYIWQYNENNASNADNIRGVSNFTVEVSLDDVNYSAPDSGASQTADRIPDPGYANPIPMTCALSMSASGIQYIKFNIDSSWGASDYIGLSEVRFEGTVTADTFPPLISTLSPENGAVKVNPDVDLVATFNDDITNMTGDITIKKLSDDSVVETFDVATSPRLTWDYTSGKALTIDPLNGFENRASYYVEIDNTAIDDEAGNSFAGISGTGTWSFTTSGLITGLTVKAVSSELTGGGRDDVDAINGAGLPGNIPAMSGTHGNDTSGMWMTDGETNGFIIVDLATNYLVYAIQVWNYNETADNNYDRGMKDVEISVSSTSDTNDLVKLTTDGTGDTDNGAGDFLFPAATGDNDYPGFEVDLTSLTAPALLQGVRLVKIKNTSNHGDPGYVGLSEVQFGGELWSEPPAGTLILIR